MQKLTKCVCCNSDQLKLVLDLGKQPLANTLKKKQFEILPTYPLAINRCLNCGHIQLTHAVDRSELFDNYNYVSGTTETLRKYFYDFADQVCMQQGAPIESILDIGCNDGSQLDAFKYFRIDNLVGVDPAKNICEIARAKGHRIENAYFDKDFIFSKSVLDGIDYFDVIIAQNVFAHNSEPLEFLLKCEEYLNPNGGQLYIQTSQADMIKRNEFDTIYHEHISFFCINSMARLLDRTNLKLVDVQKVPIHGNSYIFVIEKQKAHAPIIAQEIQEEVLNGLFKDYTYNTYLYNIETIKNDLKMVLNMQSSFPLIGYGAAAKGMVVLNYLGIRPDFIIDDNPLKQGMFTHNDVPIYSREYLKVNRYKEIIFIPLAWNFYDEIRQKIKEIRPDNNDKFLTYFPKVTMSR